MDEIKVYIDGDSLKKHCSGKYNASNLFQWISNSWKFTDIENGDCVPKIVQESNKEDAHIRMEFRESTDYIQLQWNILTKYFGSHFTVVERKDVFYWVFVTRHFKTLCIMCSSCLR